MLQHLRLLLLASAISSNAQDFVFTPGPLAPGTKGQVWPLPQEVDPLGDGYFTLGLLFNFQVTGSSCGTLREALSRYKDIITTKNRYIKERYWDLKLCYGDDNSNSTFLGYLSKLEVSLTGTCDDSEYPYQGMDEEYVLNVTSKTQKLSAKSLWGILRGLETFSQLFYLTSDQSCIRIDTQSIHDFPRFPYRGFMLDTSRHYQPENVILLLLDSLAYNKLNVFHWHITDDYSFPYESKAFPELSNKGAFDSRIFTYSQKFVKDAQEYARKRGIRVIVEFDTPGHTLSWGLSHPEILTQCVNVPLLKYGPVDPSKNETYNLIFKLYSEIKEVFKDQYVHLGGDEVDYSCWASNPNITQFMADNNIAGDYVALQSLYTQKLINYTSGGLGLKNIVWEEVFTDGVSIPPSTVVEVWKSDAPKEVLANVTKAGFPAIISSYWYLNELATGSDWLKFFNPDPLDFDGDDAQKALVLGGEICMWGEDVDEHNVIPRVWPRASAGAERLWSAPSAPITNIYAARPTASRLQEQTCRMIRRGISAQPPAGPNFCY